MNELTVHTADRHWLTIAGNTIHLHRLNAVGPVFHFEGEYKFNLHLSGSVVTICYPSRDYSESDVEKMRRQVVEAWNSV